jgi:hypothetical protein
MKAHPYADLPPPLEAESLAALVADIKANGQNTQSSCPRTKYSMDAIGRLPASESGLNRRSKFILAPTLRRPYWA